MLTNAAFRRRSRSSKLMISAALWLLISTAAITQGASPTCQSIANDIKGLKAERTSLQADLKKAAGSEKSVITGQIKAIDGQITKKETDYNKQCSQANTWANADLVSSCFPDPRSYRASFPDQNSHYRLPFDNDPAWTLGNGNWDDPTSGHCKPKAGQSLDPGCLQPYSFDFNHPVGGYVLAARPGTVYDAVTAEKGNSIRDKIVYVFKGNQYLIYDSDANQVTQDFKSISSGFQNWPAGWSSVDDAANWGNGFIYFFKGGDYLRLNVSTNAVDKGPLPIVGNWHNWPTSGPWASGIDAAYTFRGKAYFFKGGQYLVYSMDPNVDKVVTNPTSLTTITGWPSAWSSGVDAALGAKQRVYFFKGTQYLRYDIVTQMVDVAPKDISASDWPAQFQPGVSGAVRWNNGYMDVGNYLVIKHADGSFGIYWHLDQNSVQVKVGNFVNRGTVVARSGDTGRSFAPHLHFDARNGWDLGYGRTNWNEFISVPVRFQDLTHSCWVPQVGDKLISNNQ